MVCLQHATAALPRRQAPPPMPGWASAGGPIAPTLGRRPSAAAARVPTLALAPRRLRWRGLRAATAARAAHLRCATMQRIGEGGFEDSLFHCTEVC